MDAPTIPPMQLGKFKIRQHEFKSAEEAFMEEVKQNPNNHEAYFLMGFCRRRLYRVEEAVQPLEKAVELFGEDPDYLYELALTYRAVRKHGEAQKLAKRLQDLEQNRFTPEQVKEFIELCAKED